MSDHLLRRSGHTHTFPALNQAIGSVLALHRETSPYYHVTFCSHSRGRTGIGCRSHSTRNPWSRQPSWFSKNTGCQGDAEPQAEQGGLNDTVSFQFCELIIVGFFQLPALTAESTSLKPSNFSCMPDINQFESMPQTQSEITVDSVRQMVW